MYGYPETIAFRHLTAHSTGTRAPSRFALFAMVIVLLLSAALGFAIASL